MINCLICDKYLDTKEYITFNCCKIIYAYSEDFILFQYEINSNSYNIVINKDHNDLVIYKESKILLYINNINDLNYFKLKLFAPNKIESSLQDYKTFQ